MDIEQLKNLKEQVIEGSIDLTAAKDLLYSKNKRSWHTKEWKVNRDKLIKDCCEQCGSSETPTLQHTWHPRDYGSIKREITYKYGGIIREKYTVEDLVSDDEVFGYFTNNILKEEKLVCPECSSYSLSIRKTISPKYRCIKCKHEFENPVKKVLPTFIDDRIETVGNELHVITHSSLKLDIYKERCNEIRDKEYANLIENETIITSIDESIRYLLFIDTITLCKKCAFLYDVKGLNLCPICKSKYKKIYNDRCMDCRGVKYESPFFEFDE